ncbi:MAG: CARDB domain-containing protein [Thermoanaerobaculia bacterium]
MAQAQTPAPPAAISWLNGQQSGGGSWGTVPELASRDTARALIALQAVGGTNAGADKGFAWLSSQPDSANQLLAETVLAMRLAHRDGSGQLAKLAQQHSPVGADFGGFVDYVGNSYDSALALEAFVGSEQTYPTAISSIISSLTARQNADGGWGLDRGFDSNPVITAEVLVALSMLRKQTAPPALVFGAQTWLAARVHADGSIGAGALETAVAIRALAFSGYATASFFPTTLTYLRGLELPDGSWGGDVYVTSRVIEAFASDKANLTILPGNFTLSSSTVTDGGTVTATVTITNSGTVNPGFFYVSIYASDARSTPLVTRQTPDYVTPGLSYPLSLTFAARGWTGAKTLVAVVDARSEVDELREDDNEATATLTVTAKPDLQVFGSDISASPARPQPNQPAQLLITIHNNGQTDVPAAAYSVYDKAGTAPEVLLQSGTTGAIAAGAASTVQVPVTFSTGDHTIRVVVDPDNAVDELSETNNQATRNIAVTNLSNVDFRPRQLTVSPTRPAAGDSIAINAIVENAGTAGATTTITVFDGVPGAGGVPVGTTTAFIGPQDYVPVQLSYTVTGSSKVIYVVADPANAVPEIDESNNSAFAVLTDQYADLELTREGIVLPKPMPQAGQTCNARIVVKNHGALAASHVEVAIYDDLPQLGGVLALDTFVDVPANGSVVVPASWTLRAGQRFATAEVNATHVLFEPDLTNNRATKPYTVNGFDVDLSFVEAFVGPGQLISFADVSHLTVDPLTLNVSGSVTLLANGSTTKPYLATIFEDVDGDRAFDPTVDNPLGSTLVQPLTDSFNMILVTVQGTVRFAPGHLMAYLDSGNAIAENNEANNFLDIYHSCANNFGSSFTPRTAKWTTTLPSHVLSPAGRLVDTNGDGVIDGNDTPVVVIASNGGIFVKRGDNGQTVWSKPLDTSGRQISPVIADLDGDGKGEIIAHLNTDPVTGAHNQHRLIALNANDGTTKWISPQLDRDPQWEFHINTLGQTYSYGGAPAVADLDGDGIAEVICGRSVLNGADGTVKWVGTGGAGRAWRQPDGLDPNTDLYFRFFPDQEAPIAIDVDGDGKLDVVAGNTVYRYDGAVIWQRSDLPDGYTAPVWFGSETTPHICLVAQGNIWMLNSDGTTNWGPVAIPHGALLGGAPTVFPLSDNSPGVGVAGDGFYSALRASNGSVVWTQQVATDLSAPDLTATNSATVFNQFGLNTLYYAGRDKFFVMNAAFGNVQYSDDTIGANVFYPSGPAIADIDDDGHAEVIVPGRDHVRVLGDSGWYEAPSVFNEASFHAVNIDENGHVPRTEVQDSFSRTTFRATRSALPTTLNLNTNLTASYPRVDGSEYPANTKLIVRIGNNGWAASPATAVNFNRINADGSKTLLGSATVDFLNPGAYQDVVLTVNNPPATFTFSATVNPGSTVSECDGGDDTTPSFAVHLSADLAAAQAGLFVSDIQPRQGDGVDLTATANVMGSVNTATIAAQFFLGNPAAGGTAISPVLPATIQKASATTASVSYHWTVNSSPGSQPLYVLFDPQNLIPEDDETNNAVFQPITITSPDPIRKLSATITLTPPAAEPGTPVRVDVVVQNSGNVPLADVPLTYSVSGGAASGNSGTATLAALAKNKVSTLTLGTFVPSAVSTYAVNVTSGDGSTALIVSPKNITIGPFAAGMITAAPVKLSTILPLVQIHSRVTRANTILVADDPLLSFVRAGVQKAVSFEGSIVRDPDEAQCFRCHVHSQAIVSFEVAARFSGVAVNPTDEKAALDTIFKSLDGHGNLSVDGVYAPEQKTRFAAWAISYLHDANTIATYLPPMSEQVLQNQQPDGSWICTGGCQNNVSTLGPEAETMLAIDELATAYRQTADARMLDAITRGTRWLLAYDYTSRAANTCEFSARVSIALSKALPVLDAGTAALAKARIASINQQLRSFQNLDGSIGSPAYANPVTRTAQSLLAIVLGGARNDDPVVQAATLWFINTQGSNGAWPNGAATWRAMDQTSWAVIALSQAWSRSNPLDVDLHLTLPPTTDITSMAPTGVTNAVSGGRDLIWHLPDVTDAGYDIFANLKLNGIQNGEVRPVASAASISYTDPYSGQLVSHAIDVPTVTGFAPVTVALGTDRSSYGANQIVSVTESITNATDGATNDVSVLNAAGTTVAALASSEAIPGLPSPAFPGWHFTVPLTTQVAQAGTSRNTIAALDFAQLLAAAGGTGTFDPTSIRVSTDAAPASELLFTWFPSSAGSAQGNLAIQIPDAFAAGSLPLHVWFDTVENGLKPASLYDRNVLGIGPGLFATYYSYDQNHGNFITDDPSQITVNQPPVITTVNLTSHMQAPPIVNSLRFFESVWSGAIYAPISGTYQLALGSAQGSWLDIDGVRTINNGSFHGVVEVTRPVTLTAGLHRVQIILYRWDFAGFDLYLRWAPPGSGFSDIPPQNLFPDLPFAAGSPGTPSMLTSGQVTRTYSWNTGSTAAGTYTISAAVRQNGALAGGATAPIAIVASTQIVPSVATDAAAYSPRSSVHVSAAAQYASGNVTLTNLSVTTSILTPAAAVAATLTTPIPSLQPGQTASAPLDWASGNAGPGVYNASLVVKDSNGNTVAQTLAPFTIRSTSQSGQGITGTVTAPASVAQGAAAAFSVSLTNGGNAAVTNGAFAIRIVNPTTQAAAGDAPFTATIATGATTTAQVSFDTTSLSQRTYDAWLVSLISGTPVTLSRTSFTVAAPQTVVLASVTLDKSSYDAGDTLHETTSVQYVSGAAALSNVAVTATITDAANASVATSTSTIPSIAPGTTATTNFDWPVGTTAPGTYTLAVLVKDSGGATLAQSSATFTIRSTATSGAGVTGTLTTSAAVTQGDTLPLTAAITNGGNAALTNAPFAVTIASDTLPFTLSVPLAGSATKSLTYSTSSLAPGNYTATLLSNITGSAATLDTATFTVTAIPVSVAASVDTDKPSYDAGDTLHETTTVQYATGPAPLSNVSVVATITNASNAVITTSTATIASIAPGTSTTTSFNWLVGTTAPGTYTLAATVKDSGGATLAQKSATFTIRSTAASGIGVTGTLTTDSPVIKGDPLTLTATIHDDGNAPLTNAPFAVTIGADTLTFTLSVPMGGSASKQLTYATGSLSPGSYTANLVSNITGAPVTLATASVTVNPIPVSVTASIANDKTSYDAGNTLHETTTVQYVTGPGPLTNLAVTATITNASNVVMATGSSTIPSLSPGTTATTTFNWPVGTAAPGTYTLAVVVKDSGSATLAQQSSTFTIRSSAQSGAGVSGTLATNASVTKGDALPLTATITDGGNAALTDAPFAVNIASDTIPFTLSVPLAGSASKTLTYDTHNLAPGSYTATLVSMITAAPVTLAATTFTVNPVPTVVNVTVATDKSAYDCNETLHETTTVAYTSGPGTLTNVSVVVTITNSSNAVINTDSKTIASIAPGATATTSFDWPVTPTVAPGAYTLTAVVKDASGATLSQKSMTFTIRSSAVSGVGITGTVSTSSSVAQGDTLPISATIFDHGNAALTDAPFAVKISNDTLSFALSVALNSSAVKSLTYPTASLPPATYTATLISTITGTQVTLATANFTVTPAATQPTLSVGASSTPYALLWSNCSPGNSGHSCTPAPPPFMTGTLTSVGIPWVIVGDENTFLAQLRTGAYTLAILDPPPTAEPKIAGEMSETIAAGIGLLVIKDHPDAMPKLADALGTSFNGKLNASSTLLNVVTSPIATPGQLTVNGDGVKITLGTAKSAANIAATSAPAISYNVFGSGHVVVFPFDAENTPTSSLANFLHGAFTYASRTVGTDARTVVAADFAITAPTGGSQTVTLNVALPAGVVIVAASPQLTTTSPPSWTVTVPGGTTTHLGLRVRLPDAIGTYNLSGTLVVAGQPVSTKTLAFTVGADRLAIESALSSDLTALGTAAPSKDQSKVNDARNQLTALRALSNTSGTTAIDDLLKITSDLDSISIDSTAARRDTDRLLLWWQSRLVP